MVLQKYMELETIKTTVEIDAQLLYLAKMKALKEKKTLKEIIRESLARNLGVRKEKRKGKKKITIGGYHLGGIKGSLRRVAIYEDL